MDIKVYRQIDRVELAQKVTLSPPVFWEVKELAKAPLASIAVPFKGTSELSFMFESPRSVGRGCHSPRYRGPDGIRRCAARRFRQLRNRPRRRQLTPAQSHSCRLLRHSSQPSSSGGESKFSWHSKTPEGNFGRDGAAEFAR